MASNRGYDSIAFFDVDAKSGTLTLRNIAQLRGSFPRDFELMPGEKFMVVGHKMSNEIQVYSFDRATCALAPVGNPIPCWRPLCFKFVR
jgi:6-phosphogluconolactonase